MLRIFEAIKKSPFFNGNYPFCPFPKNAPAEFEAYAQLSFTLFSTSFHSRVQRVLIGISTYFFIAWNGLHLLSQHRFSLASKLSFMLLFSVKK